MQLLTWVNTVLPMSQSALDRSILKFLVLDFRNLRPVRFVYFGVSLQKFLNFGKQDDDRF